MVLVIILNLLAVVTLVYVAMTKGYERALPVAAFFIVLFPEESKLPIPGVFDLTTQRFVTITLILLAFVARHRQRPLPKKLPLQIAVAVLAAWWLLSGLNSIVMATSVKNVLAQILDYFTIYYIFAKYVTSTATVRKIIFGMVAGMVVCSVFGLLEAYEQWTVISILPTMQHTFGLSGNLYLDKSRGLRVQSTFGHPILFGLGLAMAIPMALWLASVVQKTWQKVFLWLGIMMMFTCLYKTASRGPWLALGVSLAILLMFSKTKVKKYLTVITLLAVSVLVIRPGVWETILNNYMSTVNTHTEEGESYVYRYVLYDLVIERLDRSVPRMIWGYGPQSFMNLHLQGDIHGRTMSFASCDSSIAAFMIETGYVGLLLAMWPLLAALNSAIKAYRKLPKPYNQLCMVFAVNLVAFFFQMTNVYLFGWGQQTIMLWMIVALSMIYPYLVITEQRAKSGEIPTRAPKPIARLAYAGGDSL